MKIPPAVVSLLVLASSVVRGDRSLDERGNKNQGGNGTNDALMELFQDAAASGPASNGEEDCVNFLFSIVLDEFPEDIKYSLIGPEGEVIWEEHPWGIEDQGKQFDHNVCLPPDACYSFIIYDNEEYQDG